MFILLNFCDFLIFLCLLIWVTISNDKMPRDAVNLINPALLPTFDGLADVRAFVREFFARIKLQTNDKQIQLSLLKQCLRGEVWSAYVLQQDSLNSIEDVKEWLLDRFGQKERAIATQSKMFQLAQGNFETLDSYATRILTAWQDLHGDNWPASDENAQMIILSIIYGNMRPSLKALIPDDFVTDNVDVFLSRMRLRDREALNRQVESPMVIGNEQLESPFAEDFPEHSYMTPQTVTPQSVTPVAPNSAYFTAKANRIGQRGRIRPHPYAQTTPPQHSGNGYGKYRSPHYKQNFHQRIRALEPP